MEKYLYPVEKITKLTAQETEKFGIPKRRKKSMPECALQT